VAAKGDVSNQAAEECFRRLELALSCSNYRLMTDRRNTNIVLHRLDLPRGVGPDGVAWLKTQMGKEETGAEPPPAVDPRRESAILRVLQLFNRYGCEVVEGMTAKAFEDGNLILLSAMAGYCKVMDWALEVRPTLKAALNNYVHVQPNGAGALMYKLSPLTVSLFLGQKDAALHLIRKHKVAVFIPVAGTIDKLQPLSHLAHMIKQQRNEDGALEVLRAIFYESCNSEAERALVREHAFRLDFYGPFMSGFAVGSPVGYIPVWALVESNAHRCLEYVLRPASEGGAGLSRTAVQEAVSYVYYWRQYDHNKPERNIFKCRNLFGTAIQKALCEYKEPRWQCALALLRYGGASVTFKAEGRGDPAPSVAEFIRDNGCPNRLFKIAFDAAYKKEKEEERLAKEKAAGKYAIADKEKGEVGGGSAASKAPKVDDATNAFEDPAQKPLTEKQAKEKARKKAAKKKAKAKKKAAAKEASAGACGAGGAMDVSDSDSSGEDEEEAGMDEEERMLARAPTFELEKERAARKARAEAEAQKNGAEAATLDK
jgi:hypothetical protein